MSYQRIASEAFDALVKACPKPHATVAMALLDEEGIHVDPADMSRWRKAEHDRTAPLHVVLALSKAQGSTIALEALSAHVTCEADVSACLSLISAQAAHLAGQTGLKVASAEHPDSPAGRDWTPGETIDAIASIDATVETLMQLRTNIVAKESAQQGKGRAA